MYPIRAFHMFSRFPTRVVAMLLLPCDAPLARRLGLYGLGLRRRGACPSRRRCRHTPSNGGVPATGTRTRERFRQREHAGTDGAGRVSATGRRRGSVALSRPDRAACAHCHHGKHAPCPGTYPARGDCHSGSRGSADADSRCRLASPGGPPHPVARRSSAASRCLSRP